MNLNEMKQLYKLINKYHKAAKNEELPISLLEIEISQIGKTACDIEHVLDTWIELELNMNEEK